ncbi:MAG: hypothetical protein HY914_19040 [Desulfomonile tiedjei]|nr:hypothetical protein [Desulfomonile tiedjei]
MPTLSLEQWANLARIATALITFVGIVVSVWLSTKALREVQFDRRLRARPHLAFETGGWRLPIRFEEIGHHVIGYDPECLKEVFANLPEDAESIVLCDPPGHKSRDTSFGYGQLLNHGGGSALGTDVTWVPHEVWIGSEHFDIGHKKRAEPLYDRRLNSWPAIPSNIRAGGKAAINCLPTFITKDTDKKITRVEGVLEISCKDVFDCEYRVQQSFHLFTHYKDDPPAVHVTFSDVIANEKFAG